jgi:hypothetical protein
MQVDCFDLNLFRIILVTRQLSKACDALVCSLEMRISYTNNALLLSILV